MWIAATCLALLLPPQDASSSASPPLARELRIVAVIDGVDDLVIGHTEARWTHHAYNAPEAIRINGREWDLERGWQWSVEEQPFLAPDVDLAAASVTLVRGRGEIDFAHVAGGLRIHFDDSRPGGAGEYEVLVEFADELCDEGRTLGDPNHVLEPRRKLMVEARIDGRDELQLAWDRAEWRHLAWSWPESVRIAGLDWDPQQGSLQAPEGTHFFPRGIDLDKVSLEVEQARGNARLSVAGERLVVTFDDDVDFGAADYRVRLRFPEPMSLPEPLLPTGPALRVEVRHDEALDVAGAPLTVLAESPASGEWLPWPGLRGMDFSGRCVVALPKGTYRFEVLHCHGDRMAALRTGPVTIGAPRTLTLPAGEAQPLVWREGEARLELRQLAVAPIAGGAGVPWEHTSGSAGPTLVASPGEEFALRAVGVHDEAQRLWWTRTRFAERPSLD